MKTIYRVDYSEQTGYYVQVEESVIWRNFFWEKAIVDSDGEVVTKEYALDFKPEDGWRETEREATDLWRVEATRASEAYRALSYALEDMAHGPAPTIPQNRIMMPELK
jgi:hypothetical protein